MADDESVPKPGHFLPGGAGDETGADSRPVAPPVTQRLSLGKARPVEPKTETDFGKARPVRPKSDTDGVRPVGWQSARAPLGGASDSNGPAAPVTERRFSKPVIAAICALALLAIGGGLMASLKLVDSYESLGEGPLAGPSAKPSEEPAVPLPEPTVTVTAKPVPDAVRVKNNKLYAVGKLASVNCKEPSVKPANKAAILKYYQAMLPCLNRAWAPLVRKAGYEFRVPKLNLFDKKVRSACTGQTDVAFYCGSDETITMHWEKDLKNYRTDRLAARVDMLDTIAHEYGHHVQLLTHIMISSDSREGWATTKSAKLEERRRLELQASCFAASFLGANKSSLELTGHRLDVWQYQARNSGDEYNPKKVRDHGSRKNHWYWAEPAFRSASPKSCNTFTAPAGKVS